MPEALNEIVEAVVQKVEEKKKAEALFKETGAETAPETLTVLEDEVATGGGETDGLSRREPPKLVAPELLEVQEIIRRVS